MKHAGSTSAGGTERIQKILARAGLASRRQAERWLAEGRITINGTVVTEPGTRVDPARDHIKVDGRKVGRRERLVYYLLNKPPGFVTTAKDPEGRPTVLHLLKGVRERVFPVGRLDFQSSGLLLLTNDGELADRMLRPASGCPKVYRVRVKGRPTAATLERLARGVIVDGRRTLPCRIRLIAAETNSWVQVALTEGRRNQIRRMFRQAGHPVMKLRRTAIGPLTDRGLPAGAVRRLTPAELERLTEAVS
ncbi:MAG TPA: pseudouridine synthase [Candidatus Polarisedimenticolia bacterium]|nr:pseudouridine synthase [Candidatus Polarisedimenticolia bacterium]